MNAEVDGEEVGLEGGELRAWEGFVGYDAVDEGLEELGAEEGAVAGWEGGVSVVGGLGRVWREEEG